jgi:hypothetical protein
MDCIIIATKVPVVGLNMHKIFRNKLYFYRATTLFQQAVIQHLQSVRGTAF